MNDHTPLSETSPDWKIYQEIMQCVSAYTGLKDCRNQRYEIFPYPQRTYVLSDMLKLHMLRETGDIDSYLRMETEIDKLGGRQANSHDITTRTMMQWMQRVMRDIKANAPAEKPDPWESVVLSMLIWGDKYAEKMLNSTFKSMMAEGNIPALAKAKKVTVYFQTDESTRTKIEDAPIAQKMKSLGVKFDYAIIPDELVKMLVGDMATYWMVGAGASLALHYAKYNGAAFHHSYPDIIYSENYFSELLRLSKAHKSILGPAHRADESMFLPSLGHYENAEEIKVPAADLAALHLNSVHMSMFPCIVNNRPKFWTYPQNHVMIWESDDTLYFNCPHLNALWLAPSVIEGIPDRYFMSLDSELDLICKEEDFYIPQDDDLYLVEFSEQARYPVNDVYTDAASCGRFMWNTITHRDLLKFFLRGMRVKINRNIRPRPGNAMQNMQINAERNYLFNAMISTDNYAGIQLARKRTHEGRIFAFVG